MCILKYAINGNGFYTVHYIDFGMISATGDNSAIMEGGDTYPSEKSRLEF